MIILFYAVAISGLLYFFLTKRTFDFFSLGFFASCMYFLPGFMGFTYRLNWGLNIGSRERILPGTYMILIIVLLLLQLTAWHFDRKNTNQDKSRVEKTNALLDGTEYWAVGLAILGIVTAILTIGLTKLSLESKPDLMNDYNTRWLILGESGAYIGFFLAWRKRNWVVLGLCSACLLADLFLGSRAHTAFALMSVFVYALSNRAQKLLTFRRIKTIVIGGACVLFFFFVNNFTQAWRLGVWNEYSQVASSSADYYLESLLTSEPFVVQSTLNEIIRTHFEVGPEHLKSLFWVVIPFSTELGIKPVSFNDVYQPILYRSIRSGLANNIWAQGWSVGGWPVFGLFAILYMGGLWTGSIWLRSASEFRRVFAIVVFTPWAFYIHRNDLLFQLVLERRFALMFLICSGIPLSLHWAVRHHVPRMHRLPAPPRKYGLDRT